MLCPSSYAEQYFQIWMRKKDRPCEEEKEEPTLRKKKESITKP